MDYETETNNHDNHDSENDEKDEQDKDTDSEDNNDNDGERDKIAPNRLEDLFKFNPMEWKGSYTLQKKICKKQLDPLPMPNDTIKSTSTVM